MRIAGAALAVTLVLAGCAGDPARKGGDPGARPLPPGTSCGEIKSELDRMVSRGVQSSVEAKASGRKLAPQQAADADRYNQLLNQYLGARCHT